MDIYVISIWVLLGFALSTWVMMVFWLPDPPPDIAAKYVGILVAGGLGGVIGGYLAHGAWASSDPMPALIAAAAGGLFLSGAVGFLSGAGRKSAR